MLLVKRKAAPLKTLCPFAVSIPQTKWNKGKKQGWLNLPVFVGEGHKSAFQRVSRRKGKFAVFSFIFASYNNRHYCLQPFTKGQLCFRLSFV